MRGRISWPLYIHVHRVHRVVMFVSRQMIVLGLFTSAVLVFGCNPRKREKAVCQLKSALRGEIELEATTGGDVEFSGQISSLPPGKHGFHVHEVKFNPFFKIFAKFDIRVLETINVYITNIHYRKLEKLLTICIN